jgi:VWFA-related protein
MVHRLSNAIPIFLALLLLVPPGLVSAQQPAAEQQSDETFYDTVEVNVVNVEVFVTDGSGSRIQGLAQSDFEIFEDGKPVEITNFYASEGGGGTAAAPAGAAAPAVSEMPEEQRLLLAIFVDNSNLSPQARNRVLPRIKEFLSSRLKPEDRVILSSYDGPGSLKVSPIPTGDPQVIIKALDQLAKSPGGLASGGAELRMLVSQIERSSNPEANEETNPREKQLAIMDASTILNQIRSYAQQEEVKTRGLVSSLGQFVDGLAGLPGRKAVLMVSGGVSLRPAQALYDAWENRFGKLNQEDRSIGGSRLDGSEVDLGKEIEKIGARANANRVTFYALGALDSLNVGSASTGSNEIWTRNQELVQTSNMGQSLFMIAAPTGGMATVNAVDPGAVLAQMREDMDAFYSLGYTPSHRRSGKNHKIQVKVKRAGLKVRHRESYRERTGAEVMSDKVLAALMFGSRENPLEVGLQFGEETPNGKGQNVVLVTVKLPMSRLVLLPQGQFHEGRVTIFLAARDSAGRNSPITEVKVPIRVPNEQLLTTLGQLAGYRAKLALKAVDHTVAVGVRDELGNIVSTVTASYTPGQASEAPPAPPTAPEPAAAPSADRAEGTIH